MPWDPPGTASARVRLGGNCASRRGRPQLHSLAADELHEQAVVEVVVAGLDVETFDSSADRTSHDHLCHRAGIQ